MKTPFDPRHKKREKIIKKLYTFSFQLKVPISESIKKILENLSTIDSLIQKSAPEWPIEKLNKIDLAILRLAVFELIIEKSQPHKVIIDEAIELGKEYGSSASPKFINGVLGTILKQIKVIQELNDELT